MGHRRCRFILARVFTLFHCVNFTQEWEVAEQWKAACVKIVTVTDEVLQMKILVVVTISFNPPSKLHQTFNFTYRGYHLEVMCCYLFCLFCLLWVVHVKRQKKTNLETHTSLSPFHHLKTGPLGLSPNLSPTTGLLMLMLAIIAKTLLAKSEGCHLLQPKWNITWRRSSRHIWSIPPQWVTASLQTIGYICYGKTYSTF